MRAPSLFCVRRAHLFFLQTLNNYINTYICIRIPIFASILINTAILGLKSEKTAEEKTQCNSVLDPDFGLKGEAFQYSFMLIITHSYISHCP